MRAWRIYGGRQMSDLINKRAQRNFKIASDLWEFAYAVTSHKIKRDFPEWSLSQVHEETIKRIRKGTDAGQQLPENISKHT